MLESVKRAFDKKAFDDEIVCPVDLKSIEIYLQILNSAYRIILGFQKNSSTIADVLPYLLQLIQIWNRLDVPPAPKRLCKLLIACLKYKFQVEFNSPAYKACSGVNIMFQRNLLFDCYFRGL
jgi:hypothetical protein